MKDIERFDGFRVIIDNDIYMRTDVKFNPEVVAKYGKRTDIWYHPVEYGFIVIPEKDTDELEARFQQMLKDEKS